MEELRAYLALMRPDNWIKNLFILPGFILAILFAPEYQTPLFINLVLAFICACLISSANYVINEWLDRNYDQYHPVKKNRKSVVHRLNPIFVTLEYLGLTLIGLFIAWQLSIPFLIASITLLVMGLIYNVAPFRTKDRAYLDVLSESVNNPIRLFLGWLIVTTELLPPLSLILAYWMGGAFLMAVKRYAELQLLGERQQAGRYRRSFQHYTQERLLACAVFFAACAAFFWGALVIDYNLAILPLFPLYALLFAWYFAIGLKSNSVAQHPEKIYQEKYFSAFTILVFLTTLLVLFWDFMPKG